ncbi:MAG: phosphoribosylaminoimidazolesuccinocarboxamide synthase [Rhodocyclaceae bacterium]|nr:phosphoribosylaminoimidazolesuccinocarboxamide synthase [Rhodocyclaceae bacterium]MCA3073291.1 phosphoribosylaminoimidazolesuccinocarboxamide synthase [Rhodocyclaceae bacterium]MCA3091331.1 phosphoribosylaminoimidazolesuccinocarboxamide synthase [Rhodocyclaceae bacterium]MCA3094140.1 phosphoribosylaminoimidazolesuccinocarboxamide synthase [Rhodocyclaceae bacterium]MCA3098314.1 phosphoribosylaminoimidazolesuccinocarboxamide synthase [Rhodocyclaceae bacterium]
MSKPLAESSLKSLEFLHRGKVRDLYAIDANRLLVVQTDRLSAFDVILPDPIPDKGQVLTELSTFWFHRLAPVIRNHLLPDDPLSVVAPSERDQVAGRAMVVRRLTPLLVEAVVRGYVAGSGWKDYQETGSICGVKLPAGLAQAEKLPEPIFTPASKAPKGEHDENITFDEVERTIGASMAAKVREVSLALYREAAAHALARGIIIADTKFEFGTDADGGLWLIDEALTPDSSRFWPVAEYRTGISPPAFDKQFVRDWLESVNWDKRPPAPKLPPEILAKTAEKYREALRLLAG